MARRSQNDGVGAANQPPPFLTKTWVHPRRQHCSHARETRRAALRFGFEFEGIFRQHLWVKGRNRDTAWFAMLDGDWPRLRRACAGHGLRTRDA